jgi:uncharacterized radical SAM protein YgiQ
MKTSPNSFQFLPTSHLEMKARGWNEVDVIFVTGDAYIDHPSFAMAILGRMLDQAGYRVAILSQPNWKSVEDFKQFGAPRLFWAISAGNMDSMINHYTANRKPRSKDAYSEGGEKGKRPDRATLVYAQRAREAFKAPVILGGVEASLRRLAHYDYWSDTVKKSILLDAKADLLAFGMGEEILLTLARHFASGKTVKEARHYRGISYVLGAKEEFDASDCEILPSYEEVVKDKWQFAEATRLIYKHSNPLNGKTLVQVHGDRKVIQNPGGLPITTELMDHIYDLPYTRLPHPRYLQPIPAFEMIKDSITMMRGCFGGCTFCSITAHQGRIIQWRSKDSIINEVKTISKQEHFKGNISDLGGPTANMYHMRCESSEIESKCRKLSCVHPTICKHLVTNHDALIDIMQTARNVDGIKNIHVNSGVRMDLANRSPEYIKELAAHHVSGQLSVAPEHANAKTLMLMKKPPIDGFVEFGKTFKKESQKANKEQYLIPYFIGSHPGSDLDAMIELALFLKENGYRPRQVQDFIPAPMDIAATMYYTEMDPFTKKPVFVAKRAKERKYQKLLMQYFKPENYNELKSLLIQMGRNDLIGDHKGALISSHAPRFAKSKSTLTASNPKSYRHKKQDRK